MNTSLTAALDQGVDRHSRATTAAATGASRDHQAETQGCYAASMAAPGDAPRRQEVQLLLERHLPGLRAFIRLRAGPAVRLREETGDLVQSVCLEILTHQERFQHDGEEGFRRWLYTTALREIVNREHFHRAGRRDVQKERRAPASESSFDDSALLQSYATFCTPSRVAIVREELGRIEAAFDELPDKFRAVITLSRLVGLSHAEIAAEMGTTEGNVRVMLSRALARLAWLLRETP